MIGYDKGSNSYFIDRSTAGNVSFADGFSGRHTAPRLSQDQRLVLDIIIDNASVELFADRGLSVMTSIFFINAPFTDAHIESEAFKIKTLTYTPLSTIWK